MQTLGGIAMWGGLLLMLVGGLFFIIAAFRESILWGLGVIFLPFVPLVFLVLNWQRAKGPFFMQLYGLGFILLGVLALEARMPTPWR
ncbi:MAG: hypothetical protein ABI867_21220 [Kofleriaceae bacterium]